MRKIALVCICMAFFTLSKAQKPSWNEPVIGVEWGFGLTSHTYYSYSYVREDGTRRNGNDFQWMANINAGLTVRFGYDFGDRKNLSLITGYEGINDRFRIVPLGVRGTLFFDSSHGESSSFVFAEPGLGLYSTRDRAVFYGKIGWGKRFSLSPGTDLDLMVQYRLTNSIPELEDPDDEIVDRLFTNHKLTGFLGISMALNFQSRYFKFR